MFNDSPKKLLNYERILKISTERKYFYVMLCVKTEYFCKMTCINVQIFNCCRHLLITIKVHAKVLPFVHKRVSITETTIKLFVYPYIKETSFRLVSVLDKVDKSSCLTER